MNEAYLFARWMDQAGRSYLDPYRDYTEAEINSMPVCDLIVVMYYGKDGQDLLALNQLRSMFLDEMQYLEAA